MVEWEEVIEELKENKDLKLLNKKMRYLFKCKEKPKLKDLYLKNGKIKSYKKENRIIQEKKKRK